MAGAGLAAISLALPHAPMQDDLGVTASIAVACVGSLVLLLGASRIAGWGVQCFLVAGTLLIASAVHFSGTGNSAFALYYVWVGIYGFYFLPRAWAIAQSAFVAVAYGALLLFDDLPADAPAARWLLTVGTLIVAGTLIERLVDRVRDRAQEAEDRAQRLRAEQNRARAIIDTANEAYVAVDDQGRIIDWNPAADLTFGWARERAIGSAVIDLLVPARNRAAGRKILADLLAGDAALLDRRIGDHLRGDRRADRAGGKHDVQRLRARHHRAGGRRGRGSRARRGHGGCRTGRARPGQRDRRPRRALGDLRGGDGRGGVEARHAVRARPARP